jgi:formate dehydrogenase major subunit
VVGLATAFGAGGGTSSYEEVENTDFIVLWGSNARETHPIFFHHVLRGIRGGARLYVVDPRRTSSAQWADVWMGLDVGSDIALSNAIAREILDADLQNAPFIENATVGFDEYVSSVRDWTLERGEQATGVPAEVIREFAHAYANADRAIMCWTLGITEHHNAVDNVLALINLALLCGHVGRYGSGLNPLRGQNNVQGGGDMGAIPNKLPGFQDIEHDHQARARFEAAWDCTIPPRYGKHLSAMFEAMEHKQLTAVYVIGENPAQSEADATRARHLLEGLDTLIVQDIFLTATAELADVVLPAASSWAESEGTVTSSERRVQLMDKALEPPGNARDDIWIIAEMARRLGRDWGEVSPRSMWDELRTLSPMHAGMSYERLRELGGIQWPCPDETHPGSKFLHARLWERDPEARGPAAPLSVVPFEPPVDELTDEFPIRLTTGRRLDSFNTGVQSGRYRSPMRKREAVCLSPEDAERYGIIDGERVLVSSRRGKVEAPVRVDASLRPGLAFMTLHFPDQVDTNLLTIDATDPKSGTAEFKASAIRIDRLEAAGGPGGSSSERERASGSPSAAGGPGGSSSERERASGSPSEKTSATAGGSE